MTSLINQIRRYFQDANQWLRDTPDRALDQAYDAALKIRAIEDEHFEGRPVPERSSRHSENTMLYFRTELRRLLKIADLRMTEFKASRFVTNNADPSQNGLAPKQSPSYWENEEVQQIILGKLKFIDEVLAPYLAKTNATALVPVSQNQPADRRQAPRNGQADPLASLTYQGSSNSDDDSILDKTGILPRSILGTVNRIRRDLNPEAEEQVVQSFRSNKAKTLIAIRFLLLLMIIPLLTQQVSKTLILPVVQHFRGTSDQTEIFINAELEEEALQELQSYEHRLRFDYLLNHSPKLSEDQIEERLQEKAAEIAVEYKRMGSNAIANVFSDLLSIIAFAVVLIYRKQDVNVVKSFIDETVYGLSDSAKAFIIILFTDMFVGFHSPHGWEVLLESFARHLGLPANRSFIFLFIATFPVILDTIFKYWIFRYLNRISPSAVATYRSMNE